MLRITEKSTEKLVVENIPVPMYIICLGMVGIGISSWILLFRLTGLTGRLIGVGAVLTAVIIFIRLGETRAITVNKAKKVLYYARRGLFRIRTKKYYFFEINKIDLSEEKQPAGFDIILEKSTGSRKVLLKTRNSRFARETFELMKLYLV
ncbi:MAG TPA: hypothetical protein VNE41_08630 [Chitinophagaceae bacterium]|nr:hypothetical protein [Chitinophagaceae bacterium]